MEKKFIEIKNLKKYFVDKAKTTRALDNISLEIYQGEIFGLLGVNGAGKTTLSSILATLHPPTSGEILLNGKSIYEDIIEYRHLIGFCPQKVNLINDITVLENLVRTGRYFGISEKTISQRVDELVSKYELSKYLDSKPDRLSGGYRQRVLIARSLMHSPKIIILDEPTVGLDPNIRHNLWNNIKDLKKEGVTVVLTTHYLDEAEMLSDRICILDKGAILLIDTPQNLMSTYKKSRLEDVFIQLTKEETE